MVQIQKYGGARRRFNPNNFRGIDRHLNLFWKNVTTKSR